MYGSLKIDSLFRSVECVASDNSVIRYKAKHFFAYTCTFFAKSLDIKWVPIEKTLHVQRKLVGRIRVTYIRSNDARCIGLEIRARV